MISFNRFVANAVFSLQVLIVFFLVFQDRLVFPSWVQAAGRLHPLFVHLPIGYLLLVAFLQFFHSYFKEKQFAKIDFLLLCITALSASLAACVGIILSAEGGYDEELLKNHLISSVIFSFAMALTLWLRTYLPKQKKVYYIALGIATLNMIVAGHLGASLTHGENFLTQPLEENKKEMIITDSTSLFALAVQPILERKCFSCHNEQKSKGGLVMTSVQQLLAGSDHGAIWKAGQPDSSEMLLRARLPLEHDDHMPPAGKAQLTPLEVELLHRWITAGADVYKAWTRYNKTDSLILLALHLQPVHAPEKSSRYSFPFASESVLKKLNSPYCTVEPIATNEPALKADFYLSSRFDKKNLEALLDVKEQLIYLNLSGTPLTDTDASLLSQFVNLEKLLLSQTRITGKALEELTSLQQLKVVSLIGTAVDVASLEKVGAMPSLTEVYLWNTPVSKEEINKLKETFQQIRWVEGYKPTDKLTLTPPLLVNENFFLGADDRIILKHNLPGTTLQYTLDGNDPDSANATIYTEPIALTCYSVLKTRAVKKDWFSSAVATHHFFKKGFVPHSVELLSAPANEYKGKGAQTLTDQQKGDKDNFRDTGWLGFREHPAVALFTFQEDQPLKSVTISYHQNIGSYLMPPAAIEVWAGRAPGQLALVKRKTPAQPNGYLPNEVAGVVIPLDGVPYKYVKLVIHPVVQLPLWHSGKGKKGWVFVDEVIFE